MRSDAVLLDDIVECAARISRFIGGMDRGQFLSDEKTRAAVLHEITIMGEAANSVSPAYRDANPQIRWNELVRLRNLYIHVYHRIDHKRVWQTAAYAIPEIARTIRAVLPDDSDVNESDGG